MAGWRRVAQKQLAWPLCSSRSVGRENVQAFIAPRIHPLRPATRPMPKAAAAPPPFRRWRKIRAWRRRAVPSVSPCRAVAPCPLGRHPEAGADRRRGHLCPHPLRQPLPHVRDGRRGQNDGRNPLTAGPINASFRGFRQGLALGRPVPYHRRRTGGRVVDGTALEMRHTCKGIVGSNPTLSASTTLKTSSYRALAALPTYVPTIAIVGP